MSYKQTTEYKRILATIKKILERKDTVESLARDIYFDCQIEFAKVKDRRGDEN